MHVCICTNMRVCTHECVCVCMHACTACSIWMHETILTAALIQDTYRRLDFSEVLLWLAIPQAVSRPFFIAEDRVRAQGSPCAICGEQSGTGADFFSDSSGFPLSISFHRCYSPVPHILIPLQEQIKRVCMYVCMPSCKTHVANRIYT
jgi:hypothetical protein